jgi:ATP-dependent DNA helicase RecG
MRSKQSSTVNCDSSLLSLAKTKALPAHLQSLHSSGIQTVGDLIWILPLRLHPMPTLRPFSYAKLGEVFLGAGRIIHRELKPAFGRRSKTKFLLYNAYIVVQDIHSEITLALRFFNLWPQQKKQIEEYEKIWFLGQMQEWKSQHQIINPKFANFLDSKWNDSQGQWLIEYPTVNKVPGTYINKLIHSLPSSFWNQLQSSYFTDNFQSLPLGDAFQVLHGLKDPKLITSDKIKEATERLAYEEFFIDQLKIITRRKFIKRKNSPQFEIEEKLLSQLIDHLPFKLTADQEKSLKEILIDLKSGHPMMRMLQGDVGCGKNCYRLSLCSGGYQAGLSSSPYVPNRSPGSAALPLFY